MRFIYYWEFSRYGVALWDGVLHPQFSEELRASPYPAACYGMGMGSRAGPAIPRQPRSHRGSDPSAAAFPSQPRSRSRSHRPCPARSRGPVIPPRALPPAPVTREALIGGRRARRGERPRPLGPSERGHGVRRPGGAHHRHERVLGGGRRRPALARTQGAEPRVSDRGAAGTGNFPFRPPRVWGEAPAEAAPEP